MPQHRTTQLAPVDEEQIPRRVKTFASKGPKFSARIWKNISVKERIA
jgi:hypothetical protein